MKKLGIFFLYLTLSGSLSAWLTEPTQEAQEMVAPYLMMDDHPAKAILDEIFSTRVSTNLRTLRKAGFQDIKLRRRGMVFARHPSVPGYVFKMYCDYTGHSYSEFEKTFRKQDEHIEFVGRLQKRNQIAEIIECQQFEEFILPKKWIYAIPTETNPKKTHTMVKKFYLILAEDLDILDGNTCFRMWDENVDREFVYHFFIVYKEARLQDFGPPNQSFTKSGHLAFIDTKAWPDETFKVVRTPFFLRGELREYWKQLILNDFELSKQLNSYYN